MFFQGDHAFQMLGLGEQFKGLDGGGGIPGLVEFRQIPYLGGWVAGNVNDFSGTGKLHNHPPPYLRVFRYRKQPLSLFSPIVHIVHKARPVSYTHLDVYKRQVDCRA